ncbi:MAG: DEAD/DEAH box helicase [Ktedonobacterales bacterium]
MSTVTFSPSSPSRTTVVPTAQPQTSGALAQSTQTADQPPSAPFAALGGRQRTVQALAQMGIETPTLIQTRAIPPLLAGRDVIGQSRTGSGKTIAFGLPLIERIDLRSNKVQAIILVPTRELASQVADVLGALAAGRPIRIAQLIGGRALGPQRDALQAGAQIVVGAPGRVLDHLRQGNLDLRAVHYAVLDEADQMLDAGFSRDVERILAATPAQRQMALFTATLPQWTLDLAQRFLHDPVQVDAGEPETRPVETVDQIVYRVPDGQRLDALAALLDRRRGAEGATLVFGRTKHGIKRLAKQLDARGYSVAALQGNMSQSARDRVVADFRAGRVSILLATNVAARGLDVLSIEQVINFELPESAELFTHRIGRTGRMDRAGEAITLLATEDLPTWQKMQRDLGVKLTPRPWPQGEMPLPPPSATSNTIAEEPRRPLGNGRSSAPAHGMQGAYAPRPDQRSNGRRPRPQATRHQEW